MSNMLARTTKTEPLRSILYLGTLLLLRILGQAILYQRGFRSVSADEFARGIRATQWALQPRFDLLAGPQGAWLPFEKYVNGLLIAAWPEVILAPRVTVFLGSCLALIAIYALVYFLFDSFVIAALTSLFVVFQPWYVWLSGTPMLEMYYLAFFFAGLAFLLVWLKEEGRGFWFLAGCSFLIASGFHVQSWILINLVNLLTIGFLYQYIRQKQVGRFVRLVSYYLLSNALVIALAIVEFVDSGEVFAFLARHTSYSRWYYRGYDVSLLEKLLFYPRLIFENITPVVWVLLIVALIFLRLDRDRGWKLFLLVLAILSLTLSSVMNVLSGPPSAAPARYSLFYMLLLAPYIAYGTYHLFKWGQQRPLPISRYSLAILSVGLFLYSIGWEAVRIPDFPQGLPLEAIETGRYLNQVLEQDLAEGTSTYMVELKYWDYLAVQLTAGHHEAILFDREQDLRDRNTLSLFSEEPDDIFAELSAQNVRYVALRNSSLKTKAQQTGFLSPQQEIGIWTIYRFEP